MERKIGSCTDCGVAVGEPHVAGCDVERCGPDEHGVCRRCGLHAKRYEKRSCRTTFGDGR